VRFIILYFAFFAIAKIYAVELAKVDFKKDILPLLEDNCFHCHGDGKEKGGLTLDKFKAGPNLQRNYKTWEEIISKVRTGVMPPKERKQRPNKDERALITSWIRDALNDLYSNAKSDPGRVTVRRLNRSEYNNVIRDLMLLDFRPANDFPPDDSGYGFDNIGDVLSMSPLLMEKYLVAAEKIADQAISVSVRGQPLEKDQLTEFQRKYFRYPIAPNMRRRTAEGFVRLFMQRAYRREVTNDEVGRIMRLAKMAADNGGNFEDGIRLAVQAVLISPHFLFRWELDGAPDNPNLIRSLNEFELASRLSFFLWSSMPDDRLLELAGNAQLRKNLNQEVMRMLSDEKAKALVGNFAGQWLQLRNLDIYQPDKKLFPMFTPELRAAMRRETEQFVDHIARGNRNVLEMLSADYSFINERLAGLYGIRGVKGERFRRVSLRGVARGGILTHASVLTITSDPNRTSPVKRGKFVLENILGTPPPDPPPDVPGLGEAGNIPGTLREQLERHRKDAVCASCHKAMDPIGFAFEHFDAIGRHRTKDNGKLIDASGQLESGESFKDAVSLRRILANQKSDYFIRCLTEKMLTYALGRGLEYYDRRTVDNIVLRLKKKDYRFNELIVGVVTSLPFDKKRGEAGK